MRAATSMIRKTGSEFISKGLCLTVDGRTEGCTKATGSTGSSTAKVSTPTKTRSGRKDTGRKGIGSNG